ncbi:5 nucleotid C, Metallophos, and/or PGA cap domain containing protein [Asbolus verrucosus]|uniref:apyrase n=1 Tax=Asbolus verrucosus TaxID=1661398 RepID=A0A482VJ63_ASBVE|nr:5 nucleotid C, Metallophos, and/or PGA cap domain containing protein [Asbolus verrucosus]
MKERPNPLLLNAGDNFQGTLWYIVHRWNVTQHFLNKLPFDAITIGNHEFDDGIAGLVPFLKTIRAPVIVSNIDATKEPALQNLYNKSVIVEKNGRKIGIIGAITTTTTQTSHTENLIFEDESASVNAEAKRLEGEVFTNIVLSHCGYEADLEIARKSTGKISLIVGGHTDTFLYSGTPVPGPDKPLGPYPTVVLNENGNSVLVVQASAYTKYLGNLTVVYDDFGNVTTWHGNPVFLEPKLPTDPDIDAELKIWQEAVDREGNKTVGETLIEMPNSPCRATECSLGNFATDAMVAYVRFSFMHSRTYYLFFPLQYMNEADERSWTYLIAMIHAGGMRAGIEKGPISFNELIATFPFQDTIDVFDIKGKHIKKILESCMDDVHLKWPHLFQVSGLRVVFNTTNPEGQRVQSLKIRCRECTTPVFDNVVLEKYYKILLPTFLTSSGFNPLFKQYLINKQIGDLDSTVYAKYLMERNPLFQQVEDRIEITS